MIDTLRRSQTYRDFEGAFTAVTGLPVSLQPVESWHLPHRARTNENPFCAMLAQSNKSCAACLRSHDQLARSAQFEAQTMACFSGMSDAAVPVRSGENIVGYLQTGQIFTKKPTPAQFSRTQKQLTDWNLDAAAPEVRDAYFSTRVLSPEQFNGVVTLLRIFAQHLSSISNQVIVQQQNSEMPMITRAKEYIARNQGEALSLSQVARAVNTSTFYFCKMFKKATGLNFTDYVSRVRVEKAKNLLLNPNLRVSEIAFEIGFQSLTHFNRVFKKITGESPTEYRGKIVRPR